MSRLSREERTIAVMIALYCRDNHGGATEPLAGRAVAEAGERRGRTLCAECESLLAYAARRLDRCRFGRKKPTCAHCLVHCYRSDMREKIRMVMRYSGPRMTVRHPILAFGHLIDSWRATSVGRVGERADEGD